MSPFNLLLLVLVLAPQMLEAKPDCTCQTDGTKLADEYSCSRYYICRRGKARPRRCRRGLHFDSESLVCNSPSLAKCHVTRLVTPAPQTEDDIKLYVTSCATAKPYKPTPCVTPKPNTRPRPTPCAGETTTCATKSQRHTRCITPKPTTPPAVPKPKTRRRTTPCAMETTTCATKSQRHTRCITPKPITPSATPKPKTRRNTTPCETTTCATKSQRPTRFKTEASKTYCKPTPPPCDESKEIVSTYDDEYEDHYYNHHAGPKHNIPCTTPFSTTPPCETTTPPCEEAEENGSAYEDEYQDYNHHEKPKSNTPCTTPPSTTPPCKTTTPPTKESTEIDYEDDCEDDMDKPRVVRVKTSSRDCIDLEDGTFLVDANHCSRFYVCRSGKVHSLKCSPGFWFDRALEKCRKRRDVANCPAECA